MKPYPQLPKFHGFFHLKWNEPVKQGDFLICIGKDNDYSHPDSRGRPGLGTTIGEKYGYGHTWVGCTMGCSWGQGLSAQYWPYRKGIAFEDSLPLP